MPAAEKPPAGRPGGADRPSRAFAVACVAAALLVLATHANTLRNAFHFDDAHVIVDNLYVRDLANVPRYFTDARTFSALPTNQVYRPLLTASFALDHRLGGGLESTTAFHVTQLVLLLATGALLFHLGLHVFRAAGAPGEARWAALVAATLSCVHVANTEVVNYLSARSELLAGLGVLGGFALANASRRACRAQLHLVPVALGALAKVPAVMFAPLYLLQRMLIDGQLALRDVVMPWTSSPAQRRTWVAALVGALPAFAAAIALFVFIEGMSPPTQTHGGSGRAEYLATQGWVWVRYARLFVLPAGLSADTDMTVLRDALDVRVLAGACLLAASLVVAWRTSRTAAGRPVAFGILWAWVAVAPSSSVFPLAEVTNDHRMFFPFMGLTLAATWAAWRLVRAMAASRAAPTRGAVVAAGVLALAVLLAHAAGSHVRNRTWRDDLTLWSAVVVESPGNGRGHMNHGLALMRRARYPEAKAAFDRALELTPHYALLHVNRAILANAMGDPTAAEASFARALELRPDEVAAHRYYARFLVRQGRPADAARHLRRAIELSAGDVDTRHELLHLTALLGTPEELAALVADTLRIVPGDPIASSLAAGRPGGGPASDDARAWFSHGLARASADDQVGAALAYRTATRLDPADADAWNNLGFTLARLGLYREAVAPLERAVALRPDYELALNNLAWARSELPKSRFRDAFALQQEGRAEEALAVYRELVAEFPRWANARFNMAHALIATGRCDLAAAELEAVLAIRSDFPGARANLDLCRERLAGRSVAAGDGSPS